MEKHGGFSLWACLFFAPREWGSTRVLLAFRDLWYCYAIVTEEVHGQYGAVWARFVLVTSLLLCFRFSTLLARYYRRAPSEGR